MDHTLYPRNFASCRVVQVFTQMSSFFVIHNLVYSQYMYLTLLEFYNGFFHSSCGVMLGLVDPCVQKAQALLKDAYTQLMKF